jgi:hypothetical protein
MESELKSILPFVSEYGVYFAGIAALISYLSEVYSSLKRTGPATAWTNFKMLGRLAITTASVAVGFFIVSAQYEKKSPVAQSADHIISGYHGCLDSVNSLPGPEQARIAKSLRPAELQCLAYAIQRDPPDHTSADAAIALAEDMELGQRLLHDRASDHPAGNVLYDYFGIHGDTFLGTGSSVPSDDTEKYSSARVREFLTPNACAEVSCPPARARQDTVWAWSIAPDQLSKFSVNDILVHEPPHAGGADLSQLWASHGRDDTPSPWLIRFARIPAGKYQGTTGKPNAAYVFFSDLSQLQDLSLRDAFARSGATTQDLDEEDPTRKIFIWIEAPPENGDFTKVATWHNVFALLQKTYVDRAVYNAASARPDSFLRRLEDRSAS